MGGTRGTAVEDLEASDEGNNVGICFENAIESGTEDTGRVAGRGEGGEGDGGEEVVAGRSEPGLADEGAGGEGGVVGVDVVDDGVDELLGKERRAHGGEADAKRILKRQGDRSHQSSGPSHHGQSARPCPLLPPSLG